MRGVHRHEQGFFETLVKCFAEEASRGVESGGRMPL
jgi:hypothetical protein